MAIIGNWTTPERDDRSAGGRGPTGVPKPRFDIEPVKPCWQKQLHLAAGLYAVRVGRSHSFRQHKGTATVSGSVVIAAPGEQGVEILGAGSNGGTWLDEDGGAVIVRISREVGRLLIIAFDSGSDVSFAPLEILKLDEGLDRVGADNFRLDVPAPKSDVTKATDGTAVTQAHEAVRDHVDQRSLSGSALVTSSSDLTAVPLQLLLHIERMGDKRYNAEKGSWAGNRSRPLRIEGLAFAPRDILKGQDIQYKVLDNSGREGSWVFGGTFAGTRRQSKALTGFAVRLVGPAANTHEVIYGGYFLKSGETLDVRGGEMCRSPAVNDPLCAIQVTIKPKRER